MLGLFGLLGLLGFPFEPEGLVEPSGLASIISSLPQDSNMNVDKAAIITDSKIFFIRQYLVFVKILTKLQKKIISTIFL
ncbi:hypothetical protein GCM10027442_06510 [Emticicia fontis]